jgi:UDP-glucuronate decarboxylase
MANFFSKPSGFLITGGAGFVGSHLCDELIKRGHKVVCLDNFSTGSEENIAHLLSNPNFKLIRHDITAPFYYFDIDAIFHLASPASPIHYQIDPVHTVKTNVLGTINVLELAKKLKIPVLFTSTSEVYGDPLEHPQRETYFGNVNTLSPRACYDEGKRCAETLCMDYKRQFGIEVNIVRIFNTYGPRMAKNDGRVVSNFITQALKNEDITIYGDGSQTRSFQYINDLIYALIRMMEVDGFYGPVNLGNPEEYKISELAKIILELTNSKSKLVYHPLPEGDPKVRRPDISLAREKLGWEPKVPVREGLQKIIEYFKNKLVP